jgi:hypothetical protein
MTTNNDRSYDMNTESVSRHTISTKDMPDVDVVAALRHWMVVEPNVVSREWMAALLDEMTVRGLRL